MTFEKRDLYGGEPADGLKCLSEFIVIILGCTCNCVDFQIRGILR